MARDKLVLIGLTMMLIAYLLISFEYSSEYPYFMAVLFLSATSLIVFFAFMNTTTKTWYIRGVTVNVILILLLPLIEGMFFVVISITMLVILCAVHFALHLLQKK